MAQPTQSNLSPESRPWFRGFLNNTSSRKLQEEEPIHQEDGSAETSRQSSRISLSSLSRRLDGDIAAIFVHAGAGFHSVQNERVHLKACAEAAMTFLRTGGSAVNAVEAAIKVLEDNEVTNAGYGSNLAMDGAVECDATLVDHFGRSGAVGAIRNVLNPIHVARTLLDESTQPLSLKRVPPNLLVGEGAVDYAFEHGIATLPADALVSPGAKDRWLKWTRDLDTAHRQSSPSVDSREVAALRNEAQPSSPMLSSQSLPNDRAPNGAFPSTTGPAYLSPVSSRSPSSHNTPGRLRSPLASESPTRKQSRFGPSSRGTSTAEHSDDGAAGTRQPYDDRPPPANNSSMTLVAEVNNPRESHQATVDRIVDTVGAIAVDCLGNIAAGSSSGGIGMKHRGRMGPAALVGIGTAVIPVRATDKTKMSVACVTSGTGEHMATTTAAATCAERVYANQKRSNSGHFACTYEDEAVRSFIVDDFMSHPSLRNSHSAGAIGVMLVKRSVDGVYLYFGHNTESFAMASMSVEEDEPLLTMSRIKDSDRNGDRSCSTGGRKLRFASSTNGKSKEYNKRKASGPPSRNHSIDTLTKRIKSPSKTSQLCQTNDGACGAVS